MGINTRFRLRLVGRLIVGVLCLSKRALCQDEALPAPKPAKVTQRTAPAKASATAPVSGGSLLFICDLACVWQLDGVSKGRLPAGGSGKAKAELGEHMLTATTIDGQDSIRERVYVQSPAQLIVEAKLGAERRNRLDRIPTTTYEKGWKIYNDGRSAEALKLFIQACEGKVPSGCDVAGFIYLTGKGVPEDKAKGAALFERACALGDVHGCGNFGLVLADGEGIPEDPTRAVPLLRRACEAGAESNVCTALAKLYESGTGVKKNSVEGALLYEKACRAGEQEACDLQQKLPFIVRAKVSLHNKQYKEAVGLLAAGCDAGEVEGCVSGGNMYMDGKTIEEDDFKGVALFRKGCNRNDGESCARLADQMDTGKGVSIDVIGAVRLYLRSCDSGFAHGCSLLGEVYETGDDPILKDLARAKRYYKKGCDGGDAGGCKSLADLSE